MDFVVPDKADDVFGLALKGFDAWQKSGEARTRVAALEASGEGHLAKIDGLQSHDRELPGENRRLQHQRVVVKVEKERHEAQEVQSTKTVANANVKLANAK